VNAMPFAEDLQQALPDKARSAGNGYIHCGRSALV
jgi:hypothetical protein